MKHMVQKRNIELEIILEILKERKHLREIAKNLEESPSTILRKANNLINKKIIDYAQRGKNKYLFLKKNIQTLNYIYSAEIYKLSKLLEKIPEFKTLFQEIKDKSKSGLIILFGSYAKNEQTKNSDIDIYLETENKKEKQEISKIYSKFSVKIGKFDRNSNLIKEIIKNHTIIKGFERFYEKTQFLKETS